jgi:hypothetical protein
MTLPGWRRFIVTQDPASWARVNSRSATDYAPTGGSTIPLWCPRWRSCLRLGLGQLRDEALTGFSLCNCFFANVGHSLSEPCNAFLCCMLWLDIRVGNVLRVRITFSRWPIWSGTPPLAQGQINVLQVANMHWNTVTSPALQRTSRCCTKTTQF